MSEGAEYSRLAPAEVSRMRQCCAAAEQRDAAEEHEDAVRLQQLREPLCPGSALEPQEGLRLLERVRLSVDDLRLMFQASGDRQARALFRKSHPELDSEWFNSELAAKIIMEHGVAPAPEGYALQPELKRLPLGDRRVVSMGSSGLLESQWQRQRLELDDDEPPVAVKPLVLPIENACKAGNHGLLHVLIKQDNVPIDVFDTDIARILCEHKWEAFGYKRFVGEVVCFGTQLLAWQTLSYLIAAHGNVRRHDTIVWHGWHLCCILPRVPAMLLLAGRPQPARAAGAHGGGGAPGVLLAELAAVAQVRAAALATPRRGSGGETRRRRRASIARPALASR